MYVLSLRFAFSLKGAMRTIFGCKENFIGLLEEEFDVHYGEIMMRFPLSLFKTLRLQTAHIAHLSYASFSCSFRCIDDATVTSVYMIQFW